MKLRNRFLLIATGFVLFCLVTPILVLYARGFKINLSERKLVKTGSLVVKTEPTKAQIELNGKLSKSQTPGTIRFLLPGDYDVTVKKDGYQSWTKRLTIKSQLVTWANFEREFLTLFYSSPKQLWSQTADYASGSRTDGKGLFISQGNLFSIAPNQTSPSEIGNFSDLTPFNPAVSLAKENIYQLLKAGNSLKLTADQLGKLGRIESNDSYQALTLGQDLYYKTSSPEAPLTLAASNVAGFTLFNNELWYLQNSSLVRLNLKLNLNETVNSRIPLPGKSAQILRTENYVFLVIDGSLYSVNGEIARVYDGVSYLEWDQAGQKLVFANNNEVLVFDPLRQTTDLILRSSTQITDPIINDASGYLFFANENKIKAIELDGRDHRNIYTLTDAPHSSFLLNSDATRILIYSDNRLDIYQIR